MNAELEKLADEFERASHLLELDEWDLASWARRLCALSAQREGVMRYNLAMHQQKAQMVPFENGYWVAYQDCAALSAPRAQVVTGEVTAGKSLHEQIFQRLIGKWREGNTTPRDLEQELREALADTKEANAETARKAARWDMAMKLANGELRDAPIGKLVETARAAIAAKEKGE